MQSHSLESARAHNHHHRLSDPRLHPTASSPRRRRTAPRVSFQSPLRGPLGGAVSPPASEEKYKKTPPPPPPDYTFPLALMFRSSSGRLSEPDVLKPRPQRRQTSTEKLHQMLPRCRQLLFIKFDEVTPVCSCVPACQRSHRN